MWRPESTKHPNPSTDSATTGERFPPAEAGKCGGSRHTYINSPKRISLLKFFPQRASPRNSFNWKHTLAPWQYDFLGGGSAVLFRRFEILVYRTCIFGARTLSLQSVSSCLPRTTGTPNSAWRNNEDCDANPFPKNTSNTPESHSLPPLFAGCKFGGRRRILSAIDRHTWTALKKLPRLPQLSSPQPAPS